MIPPSGPRFLPGIAALLVAGQARAQGDADDTHASTRAESAAAFPDLRMQARSMMIDDPFETFVRFDQLEYRNGDGDGDSDVSWDVMAWAGKDLNKVVVRSAGERASEGTLQADVELLWAHAAGPWWDWVVGLRQDLEPGPSRLWAAFGLQGLAPFELETQATVYVGDGGRVGMRLEVESEFLLTQRLILQPLAEVDWFRHDDIERGIGSGWSTLELGLRLRYEIRRELAPYVGVVHARQFGETADFARSAGGDPDETRLVAGLRVWF